MNVAEPVTVRVFVSSEKCDGSVIVFPSTLYDKHVFKVPRHKSILIDAAINFAPHLPLCDDVSKKIAFQDELSRSLQLGFKSL